MKKKKILTPEEKAIKKAEDARTKKDLEEAIDTFAWDKTAEMWVETFKRCAKARFCGGNVLTRCNKKIALTAYENDTPYCDIVPKPLFCKRTFKRYVEEFEELLLPKKQPRPDKLFCQPCIVPCSADGFILFTRLIFP
jgi:hypothetical protein